MSERAQQANYEDEHKEEPPGVHRVQPRGSSHWVPHRTQDATRPKGRHAYDRSPVLRFRFALAATALLWLAGNPRLLAHQNASPARTSRSPKKSIDLENIPIPVNMVPSPVTSPDKTPQICCSRKSHALINIQRIYCPCGVCRTGRDLNRLQTKYLSGYESIGDSGGLRAVPRHG